MPVQPSKAAALFYEISHASSKRTSPDKHFPDSLGPFSTHATVDVTPSDLRFSPDGTTWTADFAKKDFALKKIPQPTQSVTGHISGRLPTTLSADELAELGIPKTTAFFAWTSIDEGLRTAFSNKEMQKLVAFNEPDLCFLLRGGWLYFDKAGKCIKILALVPSGNGWLTFGPPMDFAPDWMASLPSSRVADVTIAGLLAAGAEKYAWIPPNEELLGKKICPHGGFAYLFPQGISRPDEKDVLELESLLASRRTIVDIFRRIDKDGNNVISKLELKTMMQTLDKATWTDEKIDNLLVHIDRNGDGIIQYMEFVEWLFEPVVQKVLSRQSRSEAAGEKSDKAGSDMCQKAAQALIADPKQVALELGRRLPPKPKVCILGGQAFRDPLSEQLVKDLAKACCETLKEKVVFLTGGMPGVQQTFAEQTTADTDLVHLLAAGQASGFSKGRDVAAGSTLGERMAIYGEIGDIYITVEGGPGVAKEADAAFRRGAAVLPMAWTGGASSGSFNFPAEALTCPSFCKADDWAKIVERGTREGAGLTRSTAEVAVSVIAGLCKRFEKK